MLSTRRGPSVTPNGQRPTPRLQSRAVSASRLPPFKPQTSKTSPRERVTIPRIPILQPSLEPTDPLRRRPMRERVRIHLPRRLLLDPIVSHRRRCVQPRLDVARLENVFFPRLVRPNPGVAVGLQLELH